MTPVFGKKTNHALGDLVELPIVASAHFSAGEFVFSNTDGYAVPVHAPGALVFAGVATAEADNRNGADGDLSVVVSRRGVYTLKLPDTRGYDNATDRLPGL